MVDMSSPKPNGVHFKWRRQKKTKPHTHNTTQEVLQGLSHHFQKLY